MAFCEVFSLVADHKKAVRLGSCGLLRGCCGNVPEYRDETTGAGSAEAGKGCEEDGAGVDETEWQMGN